MLDTGMRISELCQLKVKDFNFQKRELYVCSLKKGKNNKTGEKREVWRTVILTDRCIKCAADYFQQKFKSRNPNDNIFPSPFKKRNNAPIHRQQFWQYYDSVSDGRVYNHLLRHTCGTNLYAASKDLIVVRDYLGHDSTATTQIYVHAAAESDQDGPGCWRQDRIRQRGEHRQAVS